MGLVMRYEKEDEIPEELREDFVEDTVSEKHKGTWVHKDIFALEKSLGMERNDHKNAKASITQLNAQLAEIRSELDSLHEIGTLEELKELRRKADETNPPKIEALRSQLTATTQQLREAQSWRNTNEPRLKELELEAEKHALERDRAKAKSSIVAAVKEMQGVNASALSDNLYMQYLAGILVRSEAGEIVTADGNVPLADYAAKYARDFGLVLQSLGGGAKPPANIQRGSKAALQSAYEAAKKAGNTGEMLRIKTELGKFA